MLITFLCYYVVCIWVALPTFRKYVMPVHSGLTLKIGSIICLRNLGNIAHVHMV
jgi:hypothetical protein